MKIVLKTKGSYTLLIKVIEGRLNECQPYVVAYKYDDTSQTWEQGHYFDDLDSALEFLNTTVL